MFQQRNLSAENFPNMIPSFPLNWLERAVESVYISKAQKDNYHCFLFSNSQILYITILILSM